MPEEKATEENTQQNPEEEESSETSEKQEGETPETPAEPEETPQSPEPKKDSGEEKDTQETESKEEHYSERERRLYARAKQAESDAKKAKDELAKAKRPISNIDDILEVQFATKELDATEIDELRKRAESENISLSEARKNENFVLWQKAYKEKVVKEKVPHPSSKQSQVAKPKTFAEQLVAAETLEEKEKLLMGKGLYKSPLPRKERINFMK